MATAAVDPLPEDVEMRDAADPTADAVGEDEEAEGSGEGEGDPIAPTDDDSSEEGEDNLDDLRKVQQGFIVDEEEDDDDSDSEERRRRRRKKKKRRKRTRESDDDDLDEDDLELMEENLGKRSNRLTRVRRGRALSDSPPLDTTSLKRPREDRSGDEGVTGNDFGNIWDDERREAMEGDEIEDDDDFIEYDDDQEGELNEEERHERRRAEKQRRRAMGARPEMAGIDQSAWDEIFDVFGDGREYEWALDGDDGMEDHEDVVKPEMKYQDVFEPSEIKARHLTEEDDIIRITDIPERMQLSASSLSANANLALHEDFNLADDIPAAAEWVALRISPRIARDFFRPGAPQANLLAPLVLAVTEALDLMLIKNFEVPYIHTHRRDLISHFDHVNTRTYTELLSRDELWRVGTLGMKFRALMERKNLLMKTYQKMGVSDDYFETHINGRLNSIEAVADASEWLGMKHRQAQKDAMEIAADEDGESRKFKKPSRVSAYEVARATVTSKLADDFGLMMHHGVLNFLDKKKTHVTLDEMVDPLAYAEQFTSETTIGGKTPQEQLNLARMILATELGRDPLLRMEIRKVFEKRAVISVIPTDKGNNKIDEFHPYHNFKYLKDKPVDKMVASPQFLHILNAEHDHLVTVQVVLPEIDRQDFEDRLYEAIKSDAYTDAGHNWNKQRREVVKEAMDKFLIPAGSKWTREWLRDEVEDVLAKRCGDALQDRINMAPYKTADIELGDIPSVLAVSWGKGDPQKDSIHAVFMDEGGRLREHLKLDNLVDLDLRDAFTDLAKRRRPDVVVIGGFTVATKRLSDTIKELIGGNEPTPSGGQENTNSADASGGWGASSSQGGGWGSQPAAGGDWGSTNAGASEWGSGAAAATSGGWGNTNPAAGGASGGWGDSNNNANNSADQSQSSSPGKKDKHKERESDKERAAPIIMINDEVARVYQHSGRAEEEYGRLPLIGRYCIGLARYVQSPLNEYAALGADLASMSFDECQQVVPKEKLLVALERALVNIVNTVGVDINRAVSDAYYRCLLPFVSGLGPRKAASLVSRISNLGGTLSNRTQLISENILNLQIFLNAAGFLRIPQDSDGRRLKKKKKNNRDALDEQPDPLDDTRIHPEDYELARKMALDALELDEEDIEEGAHPSQNIATLMSDPQASAKLDVLNLDEFAVQLHETTGQRKRHTLNVIRDEIINKYGEQRKPFELPDTWDVVTMLSGETQETLRKGRIISVSILRTKGSFAIVKLDSGIEGIINVKYLSPGGNVPPEQAVQKGQSVAGMIIETYMDRFQVELSIRPEELDKGDAPLRRVPTDEFYDQAASLKAKDIQDRKKRREVDRARRVIKHPNFHNFNYIEAQDYLANQQRGDVVIRPSTKGPDHLAVTWKVDDGVYQHIDVVDPNADLNSHNVGSQLIIEGGKYSFSDLDELIVNHVKAMARKVEELMVHEKYQKGSLSEIHVYLDNAVKAQRLKQRSVYAFGLNRERPGYFTLSFKTNMEAPIQILPVKVTPQGYMLGANIERGSVADLCDSFKTGITQGNLSASGRTPYAIGGRTPAQTPGRMTPGHISSRHTPGHHTSSRPNPNTGAAGGASKTPNVYASKTPNPYGGTGGGQRPVSHATTPAWGQQQPTDQSNGWGSAPANSSWGSGANSGSAGGWGTTPQPGSGWGQPPPATTPAGMNPERARFIQANNSDSGGWGTGGGGGGGGSNRGGW